MPTLEEAMLMAEGGSEENPYIVINNDLRTITPPTSTLLLGVYNDKEVLKVPFKMPRYYDDIDLSRFSIQINYINAMRIPNFDEADDVVVEDDFITFNWTTNRSVFLKDGTVQFSVCLRLADIDGNVSKEFNTTIGYGIVLEGIEADADSEDPEAYSIIAHMIQIKNYVDGKSDAVTEVIDSAIETITAKQSRVEELVEEASEAIDETRSMVSYPNVAETAAAMSDQTKIYVYTGSETGYNTGHWYYYKTGSGWTDGGLYMSQGVNTDTTLTFPDTPADAKATGIVLSKKADYDGSYRELTSGDTYQIMSKKTVSDSGLMYPRKVETLFPNRTLGGKAFRDKLIGGSVVWNQLIQNGDFSDGMVKWNIVSTWKAKEASDNVLHLVSSSNQDTFINISQTFERVVVGHRYLLFLDEKISKTSRITASLGTSTGGGGFPSTTLTANTWTRISGFASPKTFTDNVVYIRPKNSVDEEEVDIYIKNVQLFDLTKMFGSTIADYIYNLEQSEEGAGVAYFRKYFPNDYYGYNPGEIISVTPGKFESVGFNIWDEEWEVGAIVSATGANANGTNRIRSKNHIPIIPETTYYLKSISTSTTLVFSLYYYDSNKVYLGSDYEKRVLNNTFVTPANARYMRFNTYVGYGSIYNHDICINLSDPDKNGTYEPYEHHSYPLDSTLTLRGIPKLDESNNLYYDGDTYEADGTVTRRYGIMDLGTITFVKTMGGAGNTRFYFNSMANYIKQSKSNDSIPNVICGKFVIATANNGYTGVMSDCVTLDMYGTVSIYSENYTDATVLKEAMSGVMLVYELATPTVESLNPVSSPQSIALTGMEELTDREYEAGNRDVFLPAWHESRYTLDVVGEIAFKNSYHDSLGAGVADQLMSKKKLTDTEPYTFRKTGGNLTGIGNRVYDEIVGGTVCLNQLYNNNIAFTITGLTVTQPKTGVYRFNGELSNPSSTNVPIYLTNGHVYFLKSNRPSADDVILSNSQTWTISKVSYLLKMSNNNKQINIYVKAGTYTDVDFIPQLFDLTQMFGSTIADYIYDLEQNNEGAGVAYFRKYFPNDYYEYNPGELMSVSKLISHDSVGFNLFDKNATYTSTLSANYRYYDIPFGENNLLYMSLTDKDKSIDVSDISIGFTSNLGAPKQYRWCMTNGEISKSDAGHTNLGDSGPTPPYGLLLKYVFIYPNSVDALNRLTQRYDICVNVYDPAKNGTYEPYVKHSYPLDSTLTLRGIPKLDESNNLYYDGDTYTPDGTVVRKYGIVDLGTLRWIRSTSYTAPVLYANLLDKATKQGAGMVCDKYTFSGSFSAAQGFAESPDKSIGHCHGNNQLFIRDDAYTDVTAFKEAMSGVMLIYELATPTIESAEPYQSPQVVDGGGTEEYVTNKPVKIPIGHNSSYGLDLGGKLETIVDTPSVDGTYTLKVTVTNGVPVFSWS